MREIKVGVIGMGKMGLLHSAILSSLNQCKVVTFVDSEKMVTNLLGDLSGKSVYDDYKKMFSGMT